MGRIFLLLTFGILLKAHGGQCAATLTSINLEEADSVDCLVTPERDVVILGDPVRIGLKTTGVVRAAYLDGVSLGAGGGSIRVRPSQSRWIVGMVRSRERLFFCASPLVVLTGNTMKIGTKLVRIKPISLPANHEKVMIRFLPENRDCDLSLSGCIASAVAGAIAIVSQKAQLKGFSCHGKFHKAKSLLEYQVTDFAVEDDLDCEAVF